MSSNSVYNAPTVQQIEVLFGLNVAGQVCCWTMFEHCSRGFTYLTYVTGRKIEEDSSYVTGFFAREYKIWIFPQRFEFRAQNLHIKVR